MQPTEVAPGCPYVTQPFGCTGYQGEWYAPGVCSNTWYHRGLDLAGDDCCDTPLLAAGSGAMQHVGQTFAGSDGLGPGAMVLAMDDGYLAVYGHGYAEAGVGQRVEKGQRIGRVGSQGYSTGCHLHLEICTSLGSVPNGCIDPLGYQGPGGPFMALTDAEQKELLANTRSLTAWIAGTGNATFYNSEFHRHTTPGGVGAWIAGTGNDIWYDVQQVQADVKQLLDAAGLKSVPVERDDGT